MLRNMVLMSYLNKTGKYFLHFFPGNSRRFDRRSFRENSRVFGH